MFDLGQEASKVCSHARQHFLLLGLIVGLLLGFLFLFSVAFLLTDKEGWSGGSGFTWLEKIEK